MAFKIQGTQFEYQFPLNVDLVSHDLETRAERVDAFGRDGGLRDPRREAKGVTRHQLSGFIQGETVAGALASLDAMENAIFSADSQVYLVDTVANRRVPVWLSTFEANRDAGMQIPIRATFETRESPFWEDLNPTITKTTSGNWTDLELGSASSEPQAVIEGYIAHPTLVQGSANFLTHIGNGQATAINSRGISVWGTVNAILGTTLNDPTPTRYGFGRLMDGAKMTFPSLMCRTDRLSFAVRFEAFTSWPSVNDFYLFDFYDGSLATHRYYLKLRGGTPAAWELGFANATVAGNATAYQAGLELQLSGWIRTAGTTIDATVVKARLFEGDQQIASTATFSQASVATLTKLRVGTDRDGNSPAMQIVDEVYLWHQQMSDTFLKGEALAERRLSPENRTFGWAASLGTNDFLSIDHAAKTVKRMNVSGPTLQSVLASMQGDYFKLGDRFGGDERVETVFTRQAMTTHWTYYKRHE